MATRRRSERKGGTAAPGALGPSSRGSALGIDLGGTKVVSALVGPDGRITRHSGRRLHANDGPTGVIRSVIEAAHASLETADAPPVAIGLAVAAQVDPRTGSVIHAPNLRWRDVPLARRISEALGLPVLVVNDARAGTWAEWKLGSGRGSSDLFCLFLGTGVGGSAVVDGELALGGTNAFGEVGHLTIVSGGRRCHCPNFGCLEAYAGGWAIADRAREAAASDPTEGRALIERAGGADRISAHTVVQSYRSGDALARRIVQETEAYLADGAVGIVNAFNPEVLAMCGGLVAGLPELIPVVETAVRARCQPPAAVARVVAAAFGEDAPLVGAAGLARERARRGRPPRSRSDATSR